jgi:hypothetical protein
MKIPLRSNPQHGGVLLVIMIVTALMGTALASYMSLVKSENRSAMRSLAWNSALPVAEAGIEEALTHLYYNPTTRSVNGWTEGSEGYAKERWLGNSKYRVTISTNNSPTIIAKGYVKKPLSDEFMPVPRTVQVTTTNDAMFAKAMVAKGQINLNGNNITTDSFDSVDPNYSTGGLYDASKRKDNGDVATNSGLVNSLNVGNADIYGQVSTGPGGSIAIGPNGTVGTLSWIGGGNLGIEPGRSSDDMNVSFPDVVAPFSGGAYTPTSGTVGGTSYSYVLGNGNYQMSSLSMSGHNKLYVSGNAVLYVTSTLALSGNAQIIIATNASLKLYFGGTSASIGGKGVANNSGNAMNFMYYGLPTNTSLSFSGNAAFTGVIYAPSATFSLGGGGSTTYDFVGASVTSTVNMNGHFNFHYDENLGRVGPSRGFVVTSWNEI